MRVVHANWSGGCLHVWAEIARSWGQAAGRDPSEHGAHNGQPVGPDGAAAAPHPFAASAEELAALVPHLGAGEPGPGLVLRLPARAGVPIASPRLAHALGHSAANGAVTPAELGRFSVPTLRVEPGRAAEVLELLEALGDDAAHDEIRPGPTVGFFAAAARLTRHLLAQQRFVPSLRQEGSGQIRGLWQLWAADDPSLERLRLLLDAMPAAARAAEDEAAHHPWAVLQDFIIRLGDAACRATLVADTMHDAIDGRDPAADPHVAWLTGLLGPDDVIDAGPALRGELLKRIYRWISVLEDRGGSSQWRLLLRLQEPLELAGLGDLSAPPESVRWTLSFHLQSVQSPGIIIDAEDIWLLPAGAATVEGRRIEAPHDALLAELGRAARLYKPIEQALEHAQPTQVELATAEAYRFLRQVRPILQEQGVDVEAPKWWARGPRLVVGCEVPPV